MAGYARSPECGAEIMAITDGRRDVFLAHDEPGTDETCPGSGWLIEDEDRR